MPLTPQVFPVSIRGLHQGDPRPGGIVGTLSKAENVVFEKGGESGLLAQKRTGTRLLPSTVIGPTPMSSPYDLFELNGSLFQCARNGVYGYVESQSAWARGEQQPASWLSADVRGSGPSYVQCVDQATMPSGLQMVVYEALSTPRGVYASIFNARGAAVLQNLAIDATGCRPKVVNTTLAGQDVFVITWVVSPGLGLACELKSRIISTSGATLSTTTVTAALGSLLAGGWFDTAVRPSGDVLVAYSVTGTMNAVTDVLLAGGALAGAVNTGAAAPSGGCIAAVDVPYAVSGTYIDLGLTDAANAKIRRLDSAARTVSFSANLAAGTTFRNITGTYLGNGGNTVFAWEEYDALGRATRTCLWTAVTTQVFFSFSARLKRGLGLASKAAVQNGRTVVMCAFTDPLYQPAATAPDLSSVQSTFFLIDLGTGNVFAKALQDVAGGIESFATSSVDSQTMNGTLPQLQNLSDTLIVATKRVAAVAAGSVTAGGNVAIQYRQPVTLTWTTAPTSRALVLDGSALLLGGSPQLFDGANVCMPFLVDPAQLEGVRTAGGAPLGIGTYFWCYLYAWSDNNGQVFRSAPSPALSITTIGGQQGATLTGEMYRLTSGAAGAIGPNGTNVSRCWIEVYRTSLTDPTFRMVSNVDPPIVNDPSVDVFSYVEAATDAQQAAGQPLYTLIELEHGQPPPARVGCVWQNRVVLASLDEPGTLHFSFDKQEGFGITFAQQLTYRLQGDPGFPRAMAVLDTALLVFCERAIYVVTGRPPNNAGQGGNLSDYPIPTQFGCVGPALVETTASGVFHWTAKGPYSITRDLRQVYIGQGVYDFRAANAVAIVNGADEPRTYVFTSDEQCLVYDHLFGVWSTATSHTCARANTYAGKLAWLPPAADGTAITRTDGYSDYGFASDRYISMRLALSDIHFGSVEGFNCVWQAILVGEFVEDHQINATVVYDYKSPAAVAQSFSRQVSTDFPEAYASSAVYAMLGPYAGNGNGVYAYPLTFNRLFCSAIALEIWDTEAPSGIKGAGFTLSNVVFEVGVDGRPNRIKPGMRLSR